LHMRQAALLLALAVICISATLVPKKLAGPPSEFSNHKFPNPEDIHHETSSAIIELSASAMGSWEETVPVDSNSRFTFAVVLFNEKAQREPTSVSLSTGGKQIALTVQKGRWQYSDSGSSDPIQYYVITNPTPGMYTIHITAEDATKGFILMNNDSPIAADSTMASFDTQVGESVTIIADVFHTDKPAYSAVHGHLPVPIPNIVQNAVLEVYLPDGTEKTLKMSDEGKTNDALADDGVFGVEFTPTTAGSYRFRTKLSGVTADGVAVMRSTDHVHTVVNECVKLGNQALLKLTSPLFASLLIPATVTNATPRVNVYAELFGHNEAGQETSIAWVGGMVAPVTESGETTLDIHVDLRWVKLAAAKAPFTLKNIRVEDPNAHVPVAQVGSMPVVVASLHAMIFEQHINAMDEVTAITEEMRVGPRPDEYKLENNLQLDDASTGILLTHGYCSTTNPWQEKKEFWAECNTMFFLDSKAAISNDKFAERLYNFAKEKGLTTYTVVGHSQGGMAAVHLNNYYWSGLDLVKNGAKLIQSVGTPYQGTNGASYTWLLPNGCGSVDDLTRKGAAKWLAGIREDVRKNVTYYYTQGGSKACNGLVNIVLSSPNDGTTESDWAPLPGANVGPNVPFENECHTTGMAFVAQYYNEVRNKRMAKEGCPVAKLFDSNVVGVV